MSLWMTNSLASYTAHKKKTLPLFYGKHRASLEQRKRARRTVTCTPCARILKSPRGCGIPRTNTPSFKVFFVSYSHDSLAPRKPGVGSSPTCTNLEKLGTPGPVGQRAFLIGFIWAFVKSQVAYSLSVHQCLLSMQFRATPCKFVGRTQVCPDPHYSARLELDGVVLVVSSRIF